MIFVFHLLAWEFAEERGGHTWGGRDSGWDWWKAGRTNLWVIYDPVFTDS